MTANSPILVSGSLFSSPVSRCLMESLTKMSGGNCRSWLRMLWYKPMIELDLKGTVPEHSQLVNFEKLLLFPYLDYKN